MLSDTFLSAIIEVGVTGAGLVLAIYALIIPISQKMFVYRARSLREQIKLFEEQRNNLTPEAKDEEFKRLQRRADAIKETRIFPRYLSVGVFFTFFAYIILAISGFALINPINNTTENEFLITVIFMIANSSFLLVGIYTILDISATMRKEYERIKKKLEPDKEFQGLFVK